MNFVNRRIEGNAVSELPLRLPSLSPLEKSKWPIRYRSIELGAIFLDVMAIVLASAFAQLLYNANVQFDLGRTLGSAALVAALLVMFLKSQGLYRPTGLLVLRRQIRQVIIAWASVFLLLSGIVFALKMGSELSRGTNLLFAAISLFLILVNRAIISELLIKGLVGRRFSGSKIVLITDPSSESQARLAQTLTAIGFEITRSFTLPAATKGAIGRKRLASSVIEHVRGSDIEEVVVAADPQRWSDLRSLAADLRVLPLPITFAPIGQVAEVFLRSRRDMGDTVGIELQRGPLGTAEQAAKRWFDVASASLILIMMAPLLLAAAIAIKLDSPGPVLFRQRRLGFNGRIFRICKFRTMRCTEDGASAVQARVGDDRITRVGRWLRRTSIDELPQLLNVLEGTMSIVGPRPHAVAHDNQFDKLVRNYGFRQRVKPGLTGWAQIHGYRGPTPTTDLIEQRVQHDLWYIDNWSLRLDFAILLQTPWEVLRGKNAY